jgi:hypothetical protein
MSQSEREVLRAAIDAAKRQYDEENPPGPDVLPRDQWHASPDAGHRPYFTEEEVARAGSMFLPRDEAASFARELYEDEGGFFLHEDHLSALSLLGEDVAERVRLLLRETAENALERVDDFRNRLAAWHADGSPREAFPQRERIDP